MRGPNAVTLLTCKSEIYYQYERTSTLFSVYLSIKFCEMHYVEDAYYRSMIAHLKVLFHVQLE